jgi:sec-independent protein translocase protein TatA
MLELVAMIGTQELIIIVVLVLLLFGGTKIPQLMRGVGRGVGELQKGLEEGKRAFTKGIDDETDKSDDQTSTIRNG